MRERVGERSRERESERESGREREREREWERARERVGERERELQFLWTLLIGFMKITAICISGWTHIECVHNV